MRGRISRTLATAVLLAAALRCAGAGTRQYLDWVRGYADALLEKARDRQGKVHSPLIASALDRRTLRFARFKGIPGIRSGDRTLSGANVMHDQNLFQMLYALSQATGEERYAAEADKTLSFFFEHCQSPTTGLLAWGEHMGWDFARDARIGDTHEFFRPWTLWPKCFALAPKRCDAFALGLWNHQIHDHKTGMFSRHARWSRHGTGTRNEYPRHGGFYIATWAHAYKHTSNPELLKAIVCLLDMFDRIRNPRTGAVPCCTRPERAKIVWPESNLSLAVDLAACAPLVPKDLGQRMLTFARRVDDMFLKLDHDFSPEGHGFVSGCNADNYERFTKGSWTHTQLYTTGYGKMTDAQEANLCHLRYQQVKLLKYEQLILAAAGRYLTTDPDPKAVVYPGAVGDVLWLLVACHELTGDAKYLDRADHVAGVARTMLFDDSSPLPKASSRHGHYEAITRADTLMMALLKLWAVRSRAHLTLVYSDR